MNSPLVDFARQGRLIRKELRESLRDRRTILTLVLMPLLLYPLLAMAFQQLILSNKADKEPTSYRVGFVSNGEARALSQYWEAGRRNLALRHGAVSTEETPDPPAPAYLDPVPELRPMVLEDPDDALRRGAVDVVVRLTPPGGFAPNPTRLLSVDARLFYLDDAPRGKEAVTHLERLTAEANVAMMTAGLRMMRVDQRGDPVRVRAAPVVDERAKKSSLLPVLVPLILILMTMTGAVYPAIDLTAGERERSTLEILVAAPIPRLSILLAKYVAVVTVALMTALVNLGTMALTLQVTGIGGALGLSLSGVVLVQILGLLALFAGFFSAVLLILTSFARSFKEAQAYLIPLMLFCLMPGVLALLPGLSLDGFLSVVPLINIVLLARDVLEGTATPATGGIVVTTTLLYAMGSVALAARIFGAEAVLSSESSGWGDLFRRADRPRDAATPSAALLCLALLFPLYFLTNASLAHLSAGLETRLALASALAVVLFAGVPLFVAWWGRVAVRPGFRLGAPSLVPFLVALVLGLSAWPLVHESSSCLRQIGFTTLRPEHLERLGEAMRQWATSSPAFLVVVLAVVPALVEELFFRGFLMRALDEEGKSPVRAVVASAGLFALFHLLVSDAIAVERLPPSLLLGLLLGWLAWRAGSIWPGVLLHMLNNALVVLLGYYEPMLVEMGWLAEGQEHLPWQVLAASAAGVVLGVGWLLIAKTRDASR
jgi:ABC-2 type transport system permease protein/sodium transport system permease protein